MNLQGLGASGASLLEGQQQIANLRQKAQQIQQGQMQLDQAKKQLQADAAVFSNLGGGQMQPPPPGMGAPPQSGQPPAPGQASMPAGGPPPGPQGPMPPQGQPQPGPMSSPQPQGGPPMAGPAPGPSMAPQPQGQPDGQNFGPQQAFQTVIQIAQAIKARNPGLDPSTLALAVGRVIDMSKELAPFQRQQLQLATAQLHAATQEDIAGQNIGSREKIAGQNIQSREKIAAGHDETSRSNVEARIQDADQRLNVTQASIDRRFNAGQTSKIQAKAQRERAALLRTQLSEAKNKLARLTSAGTIAGPQYDAATKAVDDAYNRITDLQSKVVGGQGDAGGGAPPQPPGGGAAMPTATDAKGNKVQWNGSAWVPVPK